MAKTGADIDLDILMQMFALDLTIWTKNIRDSHAMVKEYQR